MSNFRHPDREAREGARSRARRVLVCAPGGAAFAARLAAAGYEVQSVGAGAAVREIENFAPHVVVLEARGATDASSDSARATSDHANADDDQPARRADRDRPAQRGDGEPLALARRLRADHANARLPLVVVFGDARGRSRADAGESVRALALEVGADDCFALSTPAPEVLARLDALFWRVEAGRDLSSARAAHERRAEIDGFMQLLDAARTEIDAGAAGALALIASVAGDDGNEADTHESALRAAHEFFRRNLRRADAIAFYGPRLLLAHLSRPRSSAARDALARLHSEFSSAHPRARIHVGVARFPEDGTEIEELIERAEASLEDARRDVDVDSLKSGEATARRGDEQRDERTASDSSDGRNVDESATKSDGILMRFEESPAAVDEDDVVAHRGSPEGDGTQVNESSLTVTGALAPESQPPTASAHEPAQDSADDAQGSVAGRESSGAASSKGVATTKRAPRALRESQRGESFETSILPAQGAADTAGGGVLARDASEAAARERELRSRGAVMPRRVLLTVSDPARMAQVNLLLRSAGYEVRAAFDGAQALDLLRIERADLLLLDLDLKHFDGLEVLRRLNERHRGRLPLPVLLLHPRTEDGARACETARTFGARGFVALPYNPAELLEAVRETGGKD
jgi:DNA-binding response OmpR family regulator